MDAMDIRKGLQRTVVLCALAVLLLTAFQSACQESPKELYDKAVDYGKAGEFSRARDVLKKAQKLEPDRMPIVIASDFAEAAVGGKLPKEAAVLVFESMAAGNKGDWENALKLADKACTKAPGSAQAWLHLGVAHVYVLQTGGQSEHAEKAIEAYKKAIAIDPDYGLAHYNLGVALAATHQWAMAKEHLEKAGQLQIKVPSDIMERVGAEAGSGQSAHSETKQDK